MIFNHFIVSDTDIHLLCFKEITAKDEDEQYTTLKYH